MFSPGDRVAILAGENEGRGAEVVRHLRSGRVLVAVDGYSTNLGLRMYVPGSLRAEAAEAEPEVEPEPSPEPDPAPEPTPGPTPSRTASGPIEVATNGRTVEDVDVTGNVVLQDEVQDTTLRRMSIVDGTNAVIFATALAPTPPIRNTRISDLAIARMTVAGLNLRNFDGCFIDRVDVSEVWKIEGTNQHTDGIRTYGGGRNLQIRDTDVHDMGAIGFFIKDGAVDWVRLENCRWWNIVGFNTVSLYRATRVALVNCDLGGGSIGCSQGCSVYVDDATLATGRRSDLDGTTTWLAQDPWLADPAAPLRAW